jgi:hypothetical protein
MEDEKKKVVPTGKVPATGPGSKDSGSYGAGRVVTGVKDFFKGASGLDDQQRARLFPATVPRTNASLSGYPDVPGLKASEAKAGLRPKVGTSSDYSDKPPVIPGQKKDPNKLGTFTRGGKTQEVTTDSSGGLFLGKSPFKEAMFIRSEAAKTLPGVNATPAPAIPGMPPTQSVMPGGNWTGLMDMETAALTSAMSPGGGVPGATQPSFMRGGVQPGQEGDRTYRTIESQITDLFNQQKALTSGNYSPSAFGTLTPGQRMRYASQLGEQIKGLQDTLTGRSGLANELVKALIGAQAATATANTAAGAELGKAAITGDATVKAAGLDAQAAATNAGLKRNDDNVDKQEKRQISALKGVISELRQRQANGDNSPEIQKQLDEHTAALAAFGYGEDDDIDYSSIPDPKKK